MERSRSISFLYALSKPALFKVKNKFLLTSYITILIFAFLIFNSNYLAALKTALRLVQYEKELDPKEVYRLIALTSYLNKSYKECSKAVSRLEHIPNLTKEEKQKFSEMGISMFTKNEPVNIGETFIKCPGKQCDNEISEL